MTKKSITKRVVALAAATMMIVGMIVPTMAASQPDTGKITVHKMERTSPGVAHPNNQYSGEELTAAEVATLGSALPGAGFTLFELDMTDVNTEIAANRVVAGYTVTAVGDPATAYNVVFTYTDAVNPTTVVATVGTDETADGEQITDPTGTAVFDDAGADLADGFYLLVETTNPDPAKYTAAEPSVIRTPLTLADGTTRNRDIHVYPKNIDTTAPIVNKKLDGVMHPLVTNEVIEFEIATLFKNNESGASAVDSVADLEWTNAHGTNYGSVNLEDALKVYFKYLDSSTTPVAAEPEVYLLDGAGVKITGANALVAGDYTLTITPRTSTAGEIIELELTNTGIAKAVAANADKFAATFSVQYIGGASGGNAITTIENTAGGIVLPAQEPPAPLDPPTPTVTPPVITPTSTPVYFPKTVIEVDKVDELDAAFDNATFALAKIPVPTSTFDEAEWTAATPAERVTLSAGYAPSYVLDTTGKPITATSVSGKLYFNDMPYPDAGVTYYLHELSTKSGYELPAGTIAVNFPAKVDLVAGTSPLGASTTTWFDSTGNWVNGAVIRINPKVVNYPEGTDKSFSLPLTGGAGTVMFTIAGIVVMLGAATLIIKGKKKEI